MNSIKGFTRALVVRSDRDVCIARDWLRDGPAGSGILFVAAARPSYCYYDRAAAFDTSTGGIVRSYSVRIGNGNIVQNIIIYRWPDRNRRTTLFFRFFFSVAITGGRGDVTTVIGLFVRLFGFFVHIEICLCAAANLVYCSG